MLIAFLLKRKQVRRSRETEFNDGADITWGNLLHAIHDAWLELRMFYLALAVIHILLITALGIPDEVELGNPEEASELLLNQIGGLEYVSSQIPVWVPKQTNARFWRPENILD